MKLLSSKTIPVTFQTRDAPTNEKKRQITFQIFQKHEHLLFLQLTDKEQPYFLYQLQLSEQDYYQLKHQQNLLIDLVGFPEMIMNLLMNEKYHFQLIVSEEGDKSYFSFMEQTTFRQIQHLSLIFTQASNEELLKYFLDLLKDLQVKNEKLSKSLEQKEESNTSQYEQMNKEITKLRTEMDTKQNDFLQQYQQICQQSQLEKQELHLKLEKLKEESRLKEDQIKFQLQREHEQHKEQLEHARQEFQLKNQQLNSLIQQQERELEQNKRDLIRFKQLELNNEQLLLEKQKEFESKRQLEKELEWKQKQLLNSEQSKDEWKQKFNHLELQLTPLLQSQQEYLLLQKEKKGLEEKMQTVNKDLEKSNEIIAKMQNDLLQYKSKLKTKQKLEEQLEQQVKMLKEQIEELKEKKDELKEEKDKLSRDLKTMNENETELKKELEKCKKTIEENQQVIEWLHKQLNEESLQKYQTKPATTVQTTRPFSSSVQPITNKPFNLSTGSKMPISTASRAPLRTIPSFQNTIGSQLPLNPELQKFKPKTNYF